MLYDCLKRIFYPPTSVFSGNGPHSACGIALLTMYTVMPHYISQQLNACTQHTQISLAISTSWWVDEVISQGSVQGEKQMISFYSPFQ